MLINIYGYMCIQQIRLTVPFCNTTQEEQTLPSLIVRIMAVGLGSITLIIGILVLCDIPGLSSLGTMGGGSCIAGGGVVLVVGACVLYVKESDQEGSEQSSSFTPTLQYPIMTSHVQNTKKPKPNTAELPTKPKVTAHLATTQKPVINAQTPSAPIGNSSGRLDFDTTMNRLSSGLQQRVKTESLKYSTLPKSQFFEMSFDTLDRNRVYAFFAGGEQKPLFFNSDEKRSAYKGALNFLTNN